MRKKPTFEELANETLAKPTLVATPLQTVYPDDSTFAVTEFRAMMNELAQAATAAEAARFEEAAAAREAGVPADFVRQMAEGVMTANSQMHEETRRQQQYFAATTLRSQQLQAETLLREQAATRAAAERAATTTEGIRSRLSSTVNQETRAAHEGLHTSAAQPSSAAAQPSSAPAAQPSSAAAADKFAQAFPRPNLPTPQGVPTSLGPAGAATMSSVREAVSSLVDTPLALIDGPAPGDHKPKDNRGPKRQTNKH